MPFDQVMKKFKSRTLHSGSPAGPVVTNPRQAVAIKMSEQKAADAGKTEYQPAQPANPLRAVMARRKK